LQNAEYVRIIDKYLARDSQWEKCKEILKDIFPESGRVIIVTTEGHNRNNDGISGLKKRELDELCEGLQIKGESFDKSNYHDRYIETDKIKIVLSSGIDNLSDDGKDLTYVVEVKK